MPTEKTPEEIVTELTQSEAYATIADGMKQALAGLDIDGTLFPHVKALANIMPRLKNILAPAPETPPAPPPIEPAPAPGEDP